MTNALTLPGLGTVAAGRKIGYAQATTAGMGFILSLTWAAITIREWLNTGELPRDLGPALLMGLGGVMLYICAWLWAFASSLSLLRAARRAKPRM